MNFVPGEIDILVYWMHERDSIRARKTAGQPKPWTSDALLRDFRWCNVRRMDDAVSVKLLHHWYRNDADPATALTAACLGRLLNWPDSLMAITGDEWFEIAHLEDAERRLQIRRQAGFKVFTGAYVVPGSPGESKIATVLRHARYVADHAAAMFSWSMRGTWASLCAMDGLGSFLAGQMAADIAHLRAGSGWRDPSTWAPIGPGSTRGINRLVGRPKDKPVSQLQFEQELPALIEAIRPRVVDLWENRQLQAMDIQNCLCEFDKYRRLTLGEGTVRARYDGASCDAAVQTAGQPGLFE